MLNFLFKSYSTQSVINDSRSNEIMNLLNSNPEPVYKKQRIISLYFSLDDLTDLSFLYDNILKNCKSNVRYSTIARISYIDKGDKSVTGWKTLGKQMGLIFDTPENLIQYVIQYQIVILTRLKYCLSLYKIKDSNVLGIQWIFYRVYYTETVVKKSNFNPSSLGIHKDLLNVSKVSDVLNNIIPLTTNLKELGIPLEKNIKDGLVVSIKLYNGEIIDIVDRINKYVFDKKIVIPTNVDFYEWSLNESNGVKDIISVETIRSDSLDKRLINLYNINGIKIADFTDVILDSKNFTRKVSNVTVHINSNGIYKKDINVNLRSVYPNTITGPQAKMLQPDFMVGTMDLETYNDKYNISKVYAAGFYTKHGVRNFYIDNDLNSEALVMCCIDAMLVDKFNGYTFYIHNFGNFDVVFIIWAIINANKLYPEKYGYNIIFRDEQILSLTITILKNNKRFTIKLVDSYNLLQSSLAKLSKTFNTDVKKSYFPYNFVNKERLFYVGDKPDYKFYLSDKPMKKDKDLDLDIYNAIPQKD